MCSFKYLLILTLLFLTPNLIAQSSNPLVDSLTALFEQSQNVEEQFDEAFTIVQKHEWNDADQYMRGLQFLIEKAEKHQHIDWLKDFYYHLGRVYANTGEYDKADQQFDLSMQAAIQVQDSIMYAEGLSKKGFVAQNRGEYSEAMKIYSSALDVFKKIDDLQGVGQSLLSLSTTQYYMGQYEAAIEFNQQAEDIFIKKNDSFNLIFVYQEISSNYLGLETYEQALIYIKKAMAIAEKVDISPLSRASIHNESGNVHKHLAQYQIALKEYQKSHKIVLSINHPGGLSATTANISDIYMRMGKYEEALPYQLKSYELMNEHGFFMNRLENIDNLGTIYKEIGDYKKALLLREEYQTVSDSMLSAEKDEITKDIATKYQTEQKVALIELQQDQIERQKFIKLLSFCLAGLFAVVLILSYRNIKSRQNSNALLSEKNSLLDAKNQENELLLKEIHHRVKNNLQTISSLLSLQSESIDDPTAFDAVQESKNRVASMALIHQKLYQRDNLAAIEMRDYFETIGNAIIDSFGERAKRVALEIDMPELELDVDTAVPIGLITNELVTNSLKHAFPNDNHGRIFISLKKLGQDNLELIIADNGQSVENQVKEADSGGFGSLLINLLTTQLGGQIDKQTEEGMSTIISFKLPEKSVA